MNDYQVVTEVDLSSRPSVVHSSPYAGETFQSRKKLRLVKVAKRKKSKRSKVKRTTSESSVAIEMQNLARVEEARTAADIEIERQLRAISELENDAFDDTFVFSLSTIPSFISGKSLSPHPSIACIR